jgi:hypothetical protein
MKNHDHPVMWALFFLLFFAGASAEAQVLTKVGNLVAPFGGGAPDPSVNVVVGFQPKAVIFFWTKQSATGLATDASLGYGFATGPANEAAIAYAADDNLATSVSRKRQSQSRSILIFSSASAGTLDVEAELTSMNVDGFTVHWLNRGSAGWLVHYIAIGGQDVTHSTVGSFTPAAGTGNEDINGVGFEPDFVMFLSIDHNTNDATQVDAAASIGFAGRDLAGSITNGAIDAISRDNTANVKSFVRQKLGRAILKDDFVTTPFREVQEAEVTTFLPDGFRLNKYVNVTQTLTHYLALRGGQSKIDSILKPSLEAPPNQTVSETGVGFRPSGLMFVSRNRVVNVSPEEEARISFSVSDGIDERATFFHEKISSDPSEVWQGTSTTKVGFLAQTNCFLGGVPGPCPGTARVLSEADVTSFDGTGFTLNWTLNDNTNVNEPLNENPAEILYIALGEACPPLTTSEAGPVQTITVTAPKSFELTFDADFGGGVERFFDLAEDPAKSFDLAGGAPASGAKTLLKNSVLSGGLWYHPEDNTADTADARWSGARPKLDLLEATETRVKVRQDAYYQQLNGSAVLAGIKGVADYHVYGSGRIAVRFNRRNSLSAAVAMSDQDLNMGVRSECPGLGAACSDLSVFSDVGALSSGVVACPCPPGGPAGSDFLLARREVPGRKTDFLRVLYQDWGLANRSEYDETVAQILWRDNPTTGSIAANANETWNALTYFKPTNLVDQIDPEVMGRSADYRLPDALSISIGSPWNDPDENTTADHFNESEAAYLLTFDMTNGLTFDIDGGTTTRFHPFFKIRHWRSLADPPSVTLEGVALANGVDYKADVKPISRGHFAQDLLWHSALQDLASLDTTPDVGSPGTVSGTVNFVAGRYGNGADVVGTSSYFNFPTAGNFDSAKGAIEFWYRPTYASNDSSNYTLGGYNFNGANYWLFEKDNANNLTFTINALAVNSSISVSPAQYSWRAGEWVHLRFEWNDTLPITTQLRIFVNGVEPNPGGGTGADYVAATNVSMNFQIGRRSPGGGSPGIYDEVHVYGGSATSPQSLAHGGLTASASEYLARGDNNFNLSFAAVDVEQRGEHLYLGSDSKYRGLNVALATPGAGTVDLQWQFWNGTSWTDLESGFSFTDETNNLTKVGTIYWTDPFGWSPYSVNGGPDLYYVRAHLASGSYTTPPTESWIKTDLLLFQYCGDITADFQTFVFGVPAPTAVDLVSFQARGLDGAVELTWETGSEMGNLGFHLYRGDSWEGPYRKITTNVIPGLGSSPEGARYRYLDSGLVNERTYFYQLEDIETTGKSELHGPVSATPNAGAGTSNPPGQQEVPPSITFGDPEAVLLETLRRTPHELVLELRTGGFYAEAQEDGSVRISVPGFIQEETTLPLKRVSVEAVAGRKVLLSSVRPMDVVSFSGMRPSGESPLEVEATPRGTVRLRASRGRRAASPGEWARLSSVGFQGEVKKALLELSPLRWDESRGELLLARRLELRLVFYGREPAEQARKGRGHREERSHDKRGVFARLETTSPGLYCVSFEELFGRGPRARDASRLRLSRQGETVPFHIEPVGPNFGPGSKLYFVSPGARANPYGRQAVFELESGAQGLRIPQESSSISGETLSSYRSLVQREENRYYQAGLLSAPDLWLWDVLLAPAKKSYSFELSDLASELEPSRITVWVQGASDVSASPDHRLRIYVNGLLVGEGELDGKNAHRIEAALPPGALHEGENELSLENTGDTEASFSMVFLDRFQMEYRRRLVSGTEIRGTFAESGVAEAPGYGLDVTSAVPAWLGHSRAFRVEADREYLLVPESRVEKPRITWAATARLKDRRIGADYLAIGPRDLVAAAAPLLEYRRAQGLRVKGVAIEDVYDEFGFGESNPEAIRDFLTYAYHHWREPSMRYVLLLGDGTYDFKDYLGTGVVNRVPPYLIKTSYLWTASDPMLAATNGEDLLPDIAIGRLPARTLDEMRSLVGKILAYERGSANLSSTVVLVADNPDRAGEFDRDADEIAATVLPGADIRRLYLEDLGVTTTRSEILSSFDRGASLMSYLGHGGIHLWADENLLSIDQVSSLGPQPQQPLLLTMNCLNGYFHFPYFDSLAERLLKAEGKGAIAAFSPSGLSLNGPAHLYHKALLREIFQGTHARLGDAVLAAQFAYADTGAFPELLSIYHLLGDPALRLK